MNAIEIAGLNTFYGKSHILHDVSMSVAEGTPAEIADNPAVQQAYLGQAA